MRQTPTGDDAPDCLTFSESQAVLEAANDALKQTRDSTDFLVRFEDGVMTVTEGDF